jgi:hypothetical protein
MQQWSTYDAKPCNPAEQGDCRCIRGSYGDTFEYNYPGNVRELENIIEHTFVLCSSGLIKTRHPPPQFRGKGNIDTLKVKRGVTLKALEAIHIAYTIHNFMMLTTELRPGNSASIPAPFFARSSHWG